MSWLGGIHLMVNIKCAGSALYLFYLISQIHGVEANDVNHKHTAHQEHAESALNNNKVTKTTIKLVVKKIIDQATNKHVQIQLINANTGKPITPDDLDEAHTQKVHLLINNTTLEDYIHIHPKYMNSDGFYEFDWQPKIKDSNYRIWADLLPKETNSQEFVIADLVSNNPATTAVFTNELLTDTFEGYSARLSFDSTQLKAGTPAMGTFFIRDTNNNPVKNLEPIMGAYAHIVAFCSDFQTIAHVHPSGKEPTQASDKGGPEIQFHLEPSLPGLLVIFVQTRVKGKELYFRFRTWVQKSDS